MPEPNLRIVIIDVPEGTPVSYADSDGQYSLDLAPDSVLAITKQIDEAFEVGKIRQDTVANFTAPPTKKNAALLRDYGNPNAFNFNHFRQIRARIEYGDYVAPERSLTIVDTGDGDYELEFSGKISGWSKPLADQKLSDLDLGTFDFTQVNLEDLWLNGFAYQDGEVPVFPPLVNYGQWRLGNQVELEEFRLWHSPLGLLQAAFCKIGWTFRSPLLESDYGRRLWTYISKKDFRDQSVDLASRSFRAALSANLNVTLYNDKIFFDDDSTAPNYDGGANWDTVLGQFQAAVRADFVFKGTMQANVTTDSRTVVISFIVQNQFGEGVVVLREEYLFPPNTAVTVEIDLTLPDYEIPGSSVMFVTATGFNTFGGPGVGVIEILAGSYFANIVKAATYSRGDTLIISQLIDEDYSSLDYLKGIIHLFNLKAFTDENTKTVYFYPEDGGNITAQGPTEGYFLPRDQAKDISSKIQQKSLRVPLQSSNLAREFVLSFKADTKDKRIEELSLIDPLFSKKVDFGSDFAAGQQIEANPFFAPTYSDFDLQIGFEPGGTIATTRPYIPFIWDKDRLEDGSYPPQATDIAPRICLAYERSTIGFIGSLIGNVYPSTGTYVFENGVVVTEYNPFGQVLPEGMLFSTPRQNVAYGTDNTLANQPDLYETFYIEAIRRLYRSFPINLLVLLSVNDFINFSPRDRWFFKYFSPKLGEIQGYARVVKIQDFVLGNSLTTPVELLPDVSFFNIDC